MKSNMMDLNLRSKDILKHIIEAYVETGEPVGSRTLSHRLGLTLSPATIRNVMSDLEDAGYLYSPHTSAGRLPTDSGLRFFINGLLEVGDISTFDRSELEAKCALKEKSLNHVLEEAIKTLSGLTKCAGLVLAPKGEVALKHVEFLALGPERGLTILVTQDGNVENRLIDLPEGILPSTLVEASNYLNAKLVGKTLTQAKEILQAELMVQKGELEQLIAKLVQDGVGTWYTGESKGLLIVKGQGNLLQDVTEVEELGRVKALFDLLETQDSLLELLDASIIAQGVQIFIGSENPLFNTSGCSLIVAPYKNSLQKVIGAIGVIGPSRLNYARVIPMVDYTAKLIGKLLD
jgi:heat-inducible transcriptional repressor